MPKEFFIGLDRLITQIINQKKHMDENYCYDSILKYVYNFLQIMEGHGLHLIIL